MIHQKRLNLLAEASDSRLVTKKGNIPNDQPNRNYGVGNEPIYKTEVLKSNLFDYNNAYILVRGKMITTARNNPTPVAFKNCLPFTKNK